jgi:hypothetical protein
MIRIHAIVLACIVAASSATQQHVVVPSWLTSAEGPHSVGIAGFAATRRQQVLIDASHLQGLAGRTITALWFRRDTSFRRALVLGQVDLVVTLESRPKKPALGRRGA